MSAPPPGGHGPELVGASERPLELTGRAATVAVAIDARARRMALGDTEEAAPRRVLIGVEDIEADRNPGTVYGVYLTTPGAGEGDPGTHVGNLSFFGIEHVREAGDDEPHGMRHAFDVTEVVSGLRAQGLWDEEAVAVSFRPLALLPPAEGAAADRAADEVRAAAADAADEAPAVPVRIGRVSVFYE